MARFSATIYKLGINPVVDPPERVLKSLFTQAGRTKGPVPVRGKLNGAEFRQTLIRYSGAWRLYVNGVMLKASGTKVGDEVRVEIEFDESPPQVGMPEALKKALSKDVEFRKAFDALTPYRQKEILRYIGSLKSEEAIEKNVEKVSRQLKHKGV
ncbi:MAG TPA: YdeI/OmpD-associated family protein [Pyrinomonadaceae bacterium]|nr:YdeI/OmpD-associated family protein [Pyrinomonadaceae bacterium]